MKLSKQNYIANIKTQELVEKFKNWLKAQS